MIQPIRKFLVLVILLLPVLAVLSGCGGGGGGGGGGAMPAAPTGLTVTVSNKQVVLHWSAAANAATYRVYYEFSSGLSKTTGIPIAGITGTSFTGSVTNNVTYYFIVTGVNNSGSEGPASAEIAAKIAAPTPPATVVAIASSGTGTPQVTITWTGVNEATSYIIYSDTTSTVTTQLASVGTSTSYTHTPLVNGTTYYYVIRGQNAFGPGPASLVTSATPTLGAPPTINISGRITYEDKEYDQVNGFTFVTTFKAVRFADVDLVNAAGSTIATARTASDGSYSFSGLSSSTYMGTNVFVRVISSATPAASHSMNVKNWSSHLYAVNSAAFTLSGNASVNLAIPITSQADGAFNILDVMTNGFQFINFYADGSMISPLSLNAFWENAVSNGTYYCPNGTLPDATNCPGGPGISVFSDPFGSFDTDEFDDDVLYHEFGHFTADNFSLDDSPGGEHSLNHNDYDMRLAWSEGWGDFFQGAVKSWLSSTDPSLISSKTGVPLSEYVDTVDGQAALIVDIADPDNNAVTTWGGNSPYCLGNCKYSTNEISVANVLWNHMTGTGSYGMQPVWDVVAGFQSAPPSVVNLEAFWDQWLSSHNPASPILESIYSNRSIVYKKDTYETDSAFSTAQTYTYGAPQNHTLYDEGSPGADKDYVKFTASMGTTYTITTSNLLNGADTYLTLYGTDGVSEIITSATTRDNTSGITWIAFPNSGYNYDYFDASGNWIGPLNNSTNLASRIVWTATGSGTYFVKISSSPNRPLSAGRYGSYTLTITHSP